MKNSFKSVAMNQTHKNWNNTISRKSNLYYRTNDIRSPFDRDYTRIIHSNAYKRLKHKTQVFFSPESDHICTRGEHVTHVESISYTIASYLGLNTELTKAIAIAHDLGHSPFGHSGEKILNEISKRDLGIPFWHEQNGLYFVDFIELLEDNDGYKNNLNLTYGVRDGIISHCGEITEKSITPRSAFIDLSTFDSPNKYDPYTWEGCIVKVVDKISYIGRDIEDAIKLNILDTNSIKNLSKMLSKCDNDNELNNTNIINFLAIDLCMNSSLENGLCFSNEAFSLINSIKDFNYKNIYFSKRMKPSIEYFKIIINSIYNTLRECFDEKTTLINIKKIERFYPKLSNGFLNFICEYSTFNNANDLKLKNKMIYNIENINDYSKAIISYISGMTDNFAIEIYHELVSF